MNFFEYQEAARRTTRRLILYYALAVILIVLTLCGVATLLLHYGEAQSPGEPLNWLAFYDPTLFGFVTIFTTILILSGTAYKIVALSAGGEAVARMLDGRPIAPNTSQFEEKRLLNVVEEMAIASGTPIPRVFVLDHEKGINAFAAGFTPQDAVIGVTRGALDSLSRDELQGVIGHEFSHVLNGDMRLNIRLIGVLNGILVIALTGYWLFRIIAQSRSSGSSSRDKKGGNPLIIVMLLGLAMMIIGYIGVFFARLIKSAVSRQREFLADASSVQFTRNPSGLADALKKIAALTSGSQLNAAEAESVSHLFFANGVHASFLNLLATHPPLEERIQRLDPQFTGRIATPPPLPTTEDTLAKLSSQVTPPPLPIPVMAITPNAIVDRTGTLSSESLAHASQNLRQLPSSLVNAARLPGQAKAILYCLLFDRNPEQRSRQLEMLSRSVSPDVHLEMDNWYIELESLSRSHRSAIASLATATLKQLPPDEYPAFRSTVTDLVAADSQISLFEYMIMRMMVRNLDSRFNWGKRPRSHLTNLSPLAREAETVLSALAWFGTQNLDEAEKAFASGRHELGNLNIHLLSTEESSLTAMDKALDRLAEAIPPLKQKLVAAFVATVCNDGTVTPDEAEALQATADALDCPLAPLF